MEKQTERLHFRKIIASDAEQIFKCWASDDEVTKYLTWTSHQSIEDTKKIVDIWLKDYDKKDCYRYGIEILGTNKLIGMIDVVEHNDGCPEIGYVLGKKYWNKGYMTEALKMFSDFLFSEGFPKITIKAEKRNIASNRVIEKCGFIFLNSKTEKHSSLKPELVTLNYYYKNAENI